MCDEVAEILRHADTIAGHVSLLCISWSVVVAAIAVACRAAISARIRALLFALLSGLADLWVWLEWRRPYEYVDSHMLAISSLSDGVTAGVFAAIIAWFACRAVGQERSLEFIKWLAMLVALPLPLYLVLLHALAISFMV